MKRITTEIFIERARKSHGEKFDYSKSKYINQSTKVSIICPSHGLTFQNPESHIKSAFGCIECSYEYRSKILTGNINHFYNKAIEKHGFKYDYKNAIYINDRTDLEIICPEHGSFWQSPNNHYVAGCFKCGTKSAQKARAKSYREFIEKCIGLHGHIYDYSKTKYVGAHHKITVTCKMHGDFIVSANNHQRGSGCPACKNSHGELKIKSFLEERNIEYVQEKALKISKYRRLRFDYFLPKHDIYIEFQGRQHYEPVEVFGGEEAFKSLVKNDQYKRDWCKENGFKLIEISYKDLNRIDDILLSTPFN